MDYILSGILLFLGTAAIFAWYSHAFERKWFQTYFFGMSLLLVMGGFDFFMAAPNISYTVNTSLNVTAEVTNTTETYTIPVGIHNIFSAFYISLIVSFLFITAVFIIFIVIDSILLWEQKRRGG